MAFKEVATLDADETVALGGENKKTKKANPKTAEGYFLGTREVDSPKSKTGKANIHYLQTKHGNLGVWGKFDMDRKVAAVPLGTMIKITFLEVVDLKGGNTMYKYKVEQDPENKLDESALAASTAPSAQQDADEDPYGGNEDAGEDPSEPTDEELEAEAAAIVAAAERRKKTMALLSKNKKA